ncbi:MAG: hypothetical protein K0R38_1827 [Polyangiaceae bacterium]|jgi:hypothetical protein|nr:hypothetical protein [Polyangiaceae bacterium]
MKKVRQGLLCLTFGAITLLGRPARAEVTLVKADGWELFSSGRINGFVSYVNGQGFPLASKDSNGQLVALRGGGLSQGDASVEQSVDDMMQPLDQGKIVGMRVRSGFLGNILGFGVRRKLTNDGTTLTGYIAIWSFIESEARRKYRPVPADVREGYLKLEGPWGSLLVGRSLTLFSRGATAINFLYGHGLGLGYPGSVDINGPAAGHIGFGVLANGFAAGVVYATPKFAGLQLTAGAFDPSMLAGSWERTKYLRPEAELTYDLELGNVGKLHLFANGGWQKVYVGGSTRSATAYGTGYGGRLEVGPVHLGVAGHWGKGLGLSYALESNDATVASTEQQYELRTTDGYYGQLMLALGSKVDLKGGVGITRVKLLDSDRADTRNDDNDPNTPTANDDANPAAQDPLAWSVAKHQLGMSGGVTYHFTKNLHLSLDYFRANFAWYLGERQAVNFVNAGATMLW